MYSESDLDGAVEAGVLTGMQVDAFRDYVAAQRRAPAVDEEHFRLLTGFNDIFVAIAIGLLLVAVGQIGGHVATGVGALAVAIVAWALAEYFTRARRMALPSILLLFAFVGGVAFAVGALAIGDGSTESPRVQALQAAGIALAGASAAWLHWRRFAVPITVAAGGAALVALLVSTILAIFPDHEMLVWPLLFAGGIALFAVAMRWDVSDPERRTRRADVAFWLHLAAAPMIAHPLFRMLGVFGDGIGFATAAAVLALYAGFAVIALLVDRRALLVSSLAYALYAVYALVRATGAMELSAAVTGLLIGGALLSLSAFWQPLRTLVLARAGGVARMLPPARPAA